VRSSAAPSWTGTRAPSHAAWPYSGGNSDATAAAANALGGWARAMAAASGRARYSARCAHASAGAPAGSAPAGRELSGP